MMYNKIVLDYFFSPQHVGVIDLTHPLAVIFESKQKNQGGIEFYMQCSQDKVIECVCFKTNGNPYLIASLEWLCREIDGRLIDQLPPIDYQLLVNALCIPVHQYPLALRVINVFKETLTLMNNKLLYQEHHS